MCNNGGMSLRRIILLGLLVIAAGLILVQIFRPDAGLELLCYAFAVPVLVVNMWEWSATDSLQPGAMDSPGAQKLLEGLRERWLALSAALQDGSLDPAGQAEAAPVRRPAFWNQHFLLRTGGIILLVVGIWIMVAVFSRLDFGMGKLMLGMFGFIAFTTGLYCTFG